MDTHTKKTILPNKTKLASSILFSMLCATASTWVYAQESEEEIKAEEVINESELEVEEVIVTGSRTGRALNKIPGAVSIITEMEIQRDMSLTSDLTAMLSRSVPGYGQSQQQMARPGETLRGRVALRLLDGVPQGSPLRDGSRDSIFTDMGIVQRVEVINGPSATEGIGASGGIINYITKTPKEMGTELQVSMQYRTQFEDDSESWRIAFNGAHKNDNYDFLIAGSFSETGIGYDGGGRTIGIGTSGSDRDSQSNNLFLKLGVDFGENDSQRLELSHSRFLLECQCRYSIFDENPDVWNWHEANKIPITSIKESPPGNMASFNDFVQTTLTYTNEDVLGGILFVQFYDASQAMRFEAEGVFSKQDPLFQPFDLGENGFPISDAAYTPLVEQSEINSQKQGVRTSWSGESLFGNPGLGIQLGVDVVEDTAQQRLAIQNNSWVPPMKYSSFAPFVQASYDVANWTITAGLRWEDGKLKVPDYVTSWANDRRPIGGGTINYSEVLPNIGAIWRITEDWSAYASFSKGFTLPNAGIPLRNMRCSNDTSERGDPNDPINKPFGGIQPDGCPNDPVTTVNDILDLGAVVVDNIEIGTSWTGTRGKFGISMYESTSEFGTRLVVDPDVGDLVLSRKPTEIRGVELTAGYNVSDNLNLSGIYSHITGKTTNSNSKKLDREMGILNVSPDKMILTADWSFSDRGNVILGVSTILDRHINKGKSGEEDINGVTLFDATFNYDIGGGIASVGVTNLMDKEYPLTFSQIMYWKNYMHGLGREVSFGYTVTY